MNTTINEIMIDNIPDVPGLAFRYYGGEEDLPKFIEIVNEANKADRIDEIATLENMQVQFRNLRNCDPKKDFIVAEVDGEAVGYGRVWWMEVHDPEDDYYAYLHFTNLHPAWRGKGINTAMFDWLEKRAIEISQQHPDDMGKYIDTWTSSKTPKEKERHEKRGYAVTRYFFEMASDLNAPFPEAPMPEGLDVRPVEESHYRKIWEAMDEAFRDHWGHVDGTEEDYKRFLDGIENIPHRNPKYWMVAWDGDEVAGMVLNGISEEENEKLNRKWGWTDPICVRRPWRKRGLARALIVQSMQLLKDIGMEYAALGVDTNNPSGALNLYKSCGYEPQDEFMVLRKQLK